MRFKTSAGQNNIVYSIIISRIIIFEKPTNEKLTLQNIATKTVCISSIRTNKIYCIWLEMLFDDKRQHYKVMKMLIAVFSAIDNILTLQIQSNKENCLQLH